MKYISRLFFIVFVTKFSFGQSSLDSLRLVLPVGHTSEIFSVQFSHNDKFILSGSNDATARIWEVSSGRLIHVLVGHSGFVNAAEFSPNDCLIATASRDGTARIWDAHSGVLLHVLKSHTESVESALFMNDTSVLTMSDDGTIRFWNTTTGKQTKKIKIGQYESINSLAYSDIDKMILVSLKDGNCQIWDAKRGKLKNTIYAHNNMVNSASFSSNNRYIVSASSDNTAKIWDSQTGRNLHTLNASKNWVNKAEFSPNNKYVVTASGDGNAAIWEVESGSLVHNLKGHLTEVESAIFSDDNSIVLTSGDTTAKIWDVKTGDLLYTLGGHKDLVTSAVFSHDDKFIVLASRDFTLSIWETKTGRLLHFLEGQSKNSSVSILSKNNTVVTRSLYDFTWIWDINTGKPSSTFSEFSEKINFGKFSSDDKYLFTKSNDDEARIWEVKTGRPLSLLEGLSGEITSANFSWDNKIIATSSRDGKANIWDVHTGKLLQTFVVNDSNIASSVVFSTDNKLLLASAITKFLILDVVSGRVLLEKKRDVFWAWAVSAFFDLDDKFIFTNGRNFINIWEVSSGNYLHSLKGVTFELEGVNFETNSKIISSDNKYILTVLWDNTVHIWEIATGRSLFTLKKHKDDINCASFSPDDKYILTASSDRTVCVWDASSGNLLHILKGHIGEIRSCFFSSNGSQIITSATDHKTIIWNINTGKPIYERVQLENNNWLVKLPNSPYYMCSKDASKMLHYVTPSLKIIGFEQLDPVYNRPDIVLDSIGKYFGNEDRGMIDEYRKSWEKRIDRLGLDKEKLVKGEISVPNAEIVGADGIAYENKEGKLDIKVSANDPKYPLRRFNVFVNEVPLYGSAGISIAHLKKQVWDTTVSVPLSVGENKIQVSVMNELGLENFKYPTYVNYTPDKEIVAKTHYIGIGVNEFKESSHNLKYCVKDVRDLAREFASENKNVDTLLFTDQQVTKENILALKDYLNKTGVNDKVIISCSSHGLLDDSLNFYLAMHDVDFNNPKARGLKYEALESLLDGIPARQKLLLLDACNSGENDKTEILKQELQQKEKNMDSSQVLAARGVIDKLEEENKSNFKKMNELFVNVRNNTGSVIISAAGGQESAFEAIEVDGKTIKNGAFTYSILECLKQNEGKELKVNTLKQYAEKRVEEITNGKQKPTSRQETMEVDWGVW